MSPADERRKYPRFDVPCRLRIEFTDGRDLRARTANVSDGGAYFLTSEDLEVGREATVRLAVPRDTANTFFLEQFAAKAQVIRCDPPHAASLTGVALRFERPLVLDLM
jgi:c-di-GMP-binding flagellar brake protein YcgR